VKDGKIGDESSDRSVEKRRNDLVKKVKGRGWRQRTESQLPGFRVRIGYGVAPAYGAELAIRYPASLEEADVAAGRFVADAGRRDVAWSQLRAAELVGAVRSEERPGV
jgi:hypothetical protein